MTPIPSKRARSHSPPASEQPPSLARFIPVAMGHYRSLMSAEPPSTNAQFIQWQKACREILAHIDTLIRMSAENPDASVDDWIAEARDALGKNDPLDKNDEGAKPTAGSIRRSR